MMRHRKFAPGAPVFAVKCQLLMTGHELMTGVTIDSNSAWMAAQLGEIGIEVHKITTIDDSLEDLIKEISIIASSASLLLINGGLGPTDDDLTAAALAILSQHPLSEHPLARQHVENWCQQRGITANPANLKQALLPDAADIIPNASGSAMGIKMQIGQCLVLCTPGIPSEMKQMMQSEILPLLQRTFTECRPRFTRRLQIFGRGESSIQHQVHEQITDWPDKIFLGFRAGFPSLEVKLTVNRQEDIALRDQYEQKLRALLGHAIFGENQDTLQSVVVTALQKKQKKLCLAESCTGGLLAAKITSIPGASDVFESGFITYSNKIKQKILGVQKETLEQYGAVSRETVLEMARGALQKSGADYVAAISGIAGPGGGSREKPVGTVWIAWGSKENIQAQHFFYPAERYFFQELVAAYALDLIRREVLQINESPGYIK
jgi:nicotinamide-nucleotide amidase